MLDPVKNAKTVAFLLIILGVIDILGALPNLANSDPVSIFIDLGIGIFYLVVGFGLRKTKLWAIYILGVLALTQLGLLIFMATDGFGTSTMTVISLIITAILFVWFYSAKKRFS